MQGNILINRTSGKFEFFSAATAFCLWGGWAYYINAQTESGSEVISALTQGTASFIITLIMVRAVSWLFRNLGGNLFAVILASIITIAFTGTALFTAHYAVGTSAIMYTISPALSVAYLFCMFTALKLKKEGVR